MEVISVEKKTYLFAVSDEDRGNVVTSPSMDYLTGDRSKWRAEYQDGLFIHSPEGRKERSHTDTYLNYLEPGGRGWNLSIENGQFIHRAVTGGAETRKSDTCHFIGWDGKGHWASLVECNKNPFHPADLIQNIQSQFHPSGIMKDMGNKF